MRHQGIRNEANHRVMLHKFSHKPYEKEMASSDGTKRPKGSDIQHQAGRVDAKAPHVRTFRWSVFPPEPNYQVFHLKVLRVKIILTVNKPEIPKAICLWK